MTFNYKEFKRQFRKAALLRGIDPIEGSNREQEAAMRTELAIRRYTERKSSFQVALENAELRSDLHHSRERELVRAAADRQLEQARRGVTWEEGNGLLTPDRKAIDETLVTDAESATWWYKMNENDWKSGAGSSHIERQGVTLIRRNLKAQRFKAAGELMRHVFAENPTQAEMRANLSQKEVV